ncbi:DNA polymerase III subunit psi [Thorsellia anophelis]|uniref:DNA polymerase III psi subunit n=1 Tax=Thorsellia anophelis DSM 18579 TaxID=1123402 RepID=A0A1I0ECX1_9GAMM|nr:DNA polymerase III subunit psi [Thorsellia anophelis]SET43149.1 DNA polymerase III psi subunit [Thorsellia anophelis DSM 18579]
MPHLQRLKYQSALNALGIQTWTINRPNIFNGEVAVELLPEAKMIVITNSTIPFENKLISDILKSIGLSHLNLMIFSLRKIPLLNQAIFSHHHPLFFLYLPIIVKDNQPISDDDLEENAKILSLLKVRKKDKFFEVSYEDIRNKSYSKRELWKGLSDYVDNSNA